MLTHLNIKLVAHPGSTSTTPSTIRVTVLRATQGVVFAANMTQTYSPIATNTSTRLIFDGYFPVGATPGTEGYPCRINKSLKIRHKQKFTSASAGSSTGDCMYLIIQSDKVAGTTAPVLTGVVEIFFQPT